MASISSKSRRSVSASQSTSNPAHLLSGLNESDFDSSYSIQSKQPAESFGLDYRKSKDEPSPGPRHLLNLTTSRTGKTNSSQHTLDGQCNDPKDDVTPGPGAYMPEAERTMRTVYQSSPAFSIVGRHENSRYGGYDITPGPCYLLPRCNSYKRDAPHYTLVARRKAKYASRLIIEYK